MGSKLVARDEMTDIFNGVVGLAYNLGGWTLETAWVVVALAQALGIQPIIPEPAGAQVIFEAARKETDKCTIPRG